MQDRRRLIKGALAAPLLATGTAAAQSDGSPEALVERFAGSLTQHDLQAFAALFSDDYVNHQLSAAAPPLKGRSAKDATVAFFGARLVGIPDLSVEIEALVVGPDRAAASFVYKGTHSGLFFGLAPTGRPLRFTSCDIFVIRDRRIAEHWGMGDIAGVLAQLKI